MTFLIYRDSWARGGEDDSCLYSPLTQKQCILGQIGSQLGASLEDLEEVGEVGNLGPVALSCYIDAGLVRWPEDRWHEDADESYESLVVTALAENAQDINDEDEAGFTDAKREEYLVYLFAGNGHTLTFVDGVAPWLPTKERAVA